MWNDTEIPLALLITFRCYGTWLHGDLRGSVDRDHNVYGTQRIGHEPPRKDFVGAITKHEPVALDSYIDVLPSRRQLEKPALYVNGTFMWSRPN